MNIKFTLHVTKVNMAVPLTQQTEVYAKISLSEGSPTTMRTPTAKYADAVWNGSFNVKCVPSSCILIEVKRKDAFRRNPRIGEVLIGVEELLDKCALNSECELDLEGSKNSNTGVIWIRLESQSSSSSALPDSPQPFTSRPTTLQQESIDECGLMRVKKTVQELSAETNALPALGGVFSRLRKLRLEKLQAIIGVMDEVTKIHPHAQAAWKSVSFLYKTYQKRAKMDEEIVSLVRRINNILSFVEDVDELEMKLKNFTSTIETILQTIEGCSNAIHDYIKANDAVRFWKVATQPSKLSDYTETFKNLSNDLNQHVTVHTVNKIYEMHKDMKEMKQNISRPFSQSPKQHLVTIPPPPTEIFAGRDEYLLKMERYFHFPKSSEELKTQRRFVLYGTGGIGKTQIALKFIERNSDRFTRIFILDASSEESIAKSLTSIGAELGIEDADPPKVLTRLSRMKEDWLLLYDNADNPEVHIASFLPKVTRGNIIITTRNASLASLASKSYMEVLVLEEKTAVHLLLQSSHLVETEENNRLALILVNRLGCLALAIVQAGSYISSRKIPLNRYLHIYENNSTTLLRIKLGQEIDYNSPVFVTWERSYAKLDSMAQTLLNITSFMCHDHITENLFCLAVTSARLSQDLEDQWANNTYMPSHSFLDLINWLRDENGKFNYVNFAEVVHNLCSSSLVQQPFPGIYSIHILVHKWVHDHLGHSAQNDIQQDAQLLLYYTIPISNDGNYLSISYMLLPHLGVCGQPTALVILEAFSGVYQSCGYWKKAENLQRCVAELKRDDLGKEHSDTLVSFNNSALIYYNQGHWTESEKLGTEVLETQIQKLGPEHPDTLTSIAGLALTHWKQGCLTEVERSNIKILELRKQVLGTKNPNTLISMANLALAYGNQGRWTEAEKLQVEVVEALRQLTGPENPQTLMSMGNLASTYQNQGHWIKAEKLEVDVLEVWRRVLGSDHPHMLTAIARLALTYQKQSRWVEAEKLWGPDHPETLASTSSLALTYYKRDRGAEAKELLVRVLEASNQVLGHNHPNTLSIMNNLAMTYTVKGQDCWIEAEKLSAMVLEARKQVLGPEHPETLTSMNNLAWVLESRGCLEEAVALQLMAVKSSWICIGPQHPNTLESLRNLVRMFRKQRHLEKQIK